MRCSRAVRRARILGPVLAAVLALGLLGVPLGFGVLKYFLNDKRTELLVFAQGVARAATADVVRRKNPADIPHPADGTRFGVYVELERTFGEGPQVVDEPAYNALQGRMTNGTANGDLIVAVPISNDSDVIGAVRAAFPLAAIYQKAALVWLVMIGLVGLVIAAVWLVASCQARRLARPLADVSDTT